MTPEEGADILTRAADILLIDGWCQGQLHDEFNHHCIKGAVEVAACEKVGMDWRDFYHAGVTRRHPSDRDWAVMTAVRYPLERAVSKVLGGLYIPEFNDAIGTTEAEAVDTLRHAAKAVANGEIDLER